jgi:diadenosine tetraphosphate (Ap4A) HIT family hydrolase
MWMDCDFCTEFAAVGGDSRIVVEHDGWVLLPTRGCFTPGYCLLMPLDHVDAAADLHPAELVAVEATVEQMRARIEAVFGPTIVAEHGSRDCHLGAACCAHCHLHLIPVPDPDAVTDAYQTTGGAGTVLSGLSDLATAVEGPYLYLSPRPGRHLFWPADTRFARQYVRRVCARIHGVAGRYDWRDHSFSQNLWLTAGLLRGTPAQEAA